MTSTPLIAAAQRQFHSPDEMVKHYARLRKEAMRPHEIVQRPKPRVVDVSARCFDPNVSVSVPALPPRPAPIIRDYLWLGIPDRIPGAVRRAREIIAEVAGRHGVTAAEITGRHRSAPIVTARHEAIAIVYVECPSLSFPQIGRIFGKRDHSTIIHACRKMGVYREKRAVNGEVRS